MTSRLTQSSIDFELDLQQIEVLAACEQAEELVLGHNAAAIGKPQEPNIGSNGAEFTNIGSPGHDGRRHLT